MWLGGPFKYGTFWTINSLVFRPPFEYQTIWKLDTNLPYEYQTSPVFKWLICFILRNPLKLLKWQWEPAQPNITFEEPPQAIKSCKRFPIQYWAEFYYIIICISNFADKSVLIDFLKKDVLEHHEEPQPRIPGYLVGKHCIRKWKR